MDWTSNEILFEERKLNFQQLKCNDVDKDTAMRHPLNPASQPPQGNPGPRKFLSIWFQCCRTYGRLNRNREETYFEGHCPRCGRSASARIGTEGSSRRIFRAS